MRTSESGEARTPYRLTPEHVYFTFASGRLSYDCASCGSTCCRGHGYAVNSQDALVQLTRRPHLRFFLAERDGLVVQNCAPACFFLANDGRCSLQVEQGYAAKPETCRLFPFIDIRRVGQVLIVAPHGDMCPLEVIGETEASGTSTHAYLLDAMSMQRIERFLPEVAPIAGTAESVIALEREIVAASERYLTLPYSEFVGEQLRLTRKYLQSETMTESWGSDSALRSKRMLAQVLDTIGFAVEELEQADRSVGVLIAALTPFLRSRMMFRRDGAEHSDCTRDIDAVGVIFALLGVFALTSAANLAGMQRVTFQTVARIWKENHELLTLISLLGTPLVWRRGEEVAPAGSYPEFEAAYFEVARALTSSRQQSAPRTLYEIIASQNSWHGAQRMRFLRMLATRLHGRVTSSLDGGPSSASMRKRVLSQFQQLALSSGDDKLLRAVLRSS
ncbi:YkgJ family cysteine cluster protein [Gemmatimonas sp.]|uniref:YkgJ family cysteine cluster protein n=1 Tax=Gemmatimonas sp. TaxID=1962908 RepID=UPI00286A415D|nr:YkgJ family cysteine cluster protein [Gemmatimonas sp.]